MTDRPMEASARACANIALAKYWGKADVKRNVPAVPSISLTLDQLVTETLHPPQWLPSATQGTIGVQCREGDEVVSKLILPLLHPDTALRTQAERSVATLLQGSCQVPLAVFAQTSDSQLNITGLVGTPDGQTVLRSEISGEATQVDCLSAKVAEDLLRQGADQIIASLS